VVSTDDERVLEVARRHGAEVPFLRPRELAADIPSLLKPSSPCGGGGGEDGPRADVVVVLQATTPFAARTRWRRRSAG
jgi:CMP-N-acetylneuraminic acid synthetase